MTQQVKPVLEKLASGGRIEVKGDLGDKPGALTFRRIRIGQVDPAVIKAML